MKPTIFKTIEYAYPSSPAAQRLGKDLGCWLISFISPDCPKHKLPSPPCIAADSPDDPDLVAAFLNDCPANAVIPDYFFKYGHADAVQAVRSHLS